jgi:hypothetical protein
MSRGPTTRSLDERIDALSKDMKDLTDSFRDARGDLAWIKRIGAFLVAFLVAAGSGSGRIIWDASAISTGVKHQGQRLDKLDSRLDSVEKKLDMLLAHAAPAAAPVPSPAEGRKPDGGPRTGDGATPRASGGIKAESAGWSAN